MRGIARRFAGFFVAVLVAASAASAADLAHPGVRHVRAGEPQPAGTQPAALTLTRFGETRPAGWMLRQMQADLDAGLAGHYPEISDTVNHEMFADNSVEPTSWWSGEHEGYYADGLFRLAWLAGDAAAIRAASARLQQVLAAQDEDGYIGIYPPPDRFRHTGPDDGELWTQSRMFQALLAWYEATGDTRILAAVEKATKLTLAAYAGKTYFGREGAAALGGVSHGVGFADTLEWLYRLTGEDVYRRGYLWLYADYAQGAARDHDLTPANLADPDRPWYSHTPHIAEALAMPAIAYAYGGPTDYAQAAANVLAKLRRHSNPGGGPVGDESVDGRSGAFELNSEYCSMTETIASLNRLAQFHDAMATGDIAERIALNIAQGARLHTAATAVSYLTADNRLAATQTVALGDRLLYSAAHQASSCCTLNSTRLLPYYVEGMWLQEVARPGLVARLYGPSSLETTLDGSAVRVLEETDFPFSDTVQFTVYPDGTPRFTLTLRIPDYAPAATVAAPAGMAIVRQPDRFEISGRWRSGDSVTLDLAFAVRRVQDGNGETAMAFGPLLYALPLDAVALPGRITRADGVTSALQFRDTEYVTVAQPPAWHLATNASFAPVRLFGGDVLDPWSKPPNGLAGTLSAPDGSKVNVTLLPQGATLLRLTGFPTLDN